MSGEQRSSSERESLLKAHTLLNSAKLCHLLWSKKVIFDVDFTRLECNSIKAALNFGSVVDTKISFCKTLLKAKDGSLGPSATVMRTSSLVLSGIRHRFLNMLKGFKLILAACEFKIDIPSFIFPCQVCRTVRDSHSMKHSSASNEIKVYLKPCGLSEFCHREALPEGSLPVPGC